MHLVQKDIFDQVSGQNLFAITIIQVVVKFVFKTNTYSRTSSEIKIEIFLLVNTFQFITTGNF